jgi:bacterioferritin-associated ferredoxin
VAKVRLALPEMPVQGGAVDVFACICRAVTCDQVDAAVDEGAATVKEVGEATGAGTDCGICRRRIRAMVLARTQECPLQAPNVA